MVRIYFLTWLKGLARRPSLRLFDCFFAILTWISIAFVLLFDAVAFLARVVSGTADGSAAGFFWSVVAFVFGMSWATACAAVALSSRKRSPPARSIVAFPVFSMVLSASVLYTLLRPTREWKPIPHTGPA